MCQLAIGHLGDKNVVKYITSFYYSYYATQLGINNKKSTVGAYSTETVVCNRLNDRTKIISRGSVLTRKFSSKVSAENIICTNV